MAQIERFMFYYIDTVTEKRFGEAMDLAKQMLEVCEDESAPVIEGLISAANSLECLKMGEFDRVEELWNAFEESKKFLMPQNRHYALLLETTLVLENIKEEIEKIV